MREYAARRGWTVALQIKEVGSTLPLTLEANFLKLNGEDMRITLLTVLMLGIATAARADANCQPGTVNGFTNLPSSGGTFQATWTFTRGLTDVNCGSPILQSNVTWMTPIVSQTTCSPNPQPAGQLITCTTPYVVAQNTGSSRSGQLFVNFGSSGTISQNILQFGPPEQLTVSVSGNGRVTSSPGGISCPGTCSTPFPLGTAVTLSASPSPGFVFSGWSGACSGTGPCNFVMSTPLNVTATFTALQTLTVGVSGNGTVTSSPGGISCPGACSASFLQGTTVALSASPSPGFVFSGWSGACSGTGSCTVVMSSAQTVTATFAGDFSLGVSPASLFVLQGTSTSYQVTVTQINGFTGTTALSVSGLPSGVSGSFSPASLSSGSSTLTLSSAAGSASGTFAISITGTSGSLSHTISANLNIDLNRTGFLDNNGTLFVKEGSLSAAWVEEYATAALPNAGVATQVAMSGDRIGFLDNNGTFFVKEGGLSAAWVEVYATGVLPNAGVATQVAMSGDRIAFLDNNGTFFVKEGGLSAAWVEVCATGVLPNSGVAKQIALSGDQIAFLDNNGSYFVKQGGLGAAWVEVYSTGALPNAGVATQVALSVASSGDRIGFLDNNGAFFIKEGGLSAAWVEEYATGALPNAGVVSRLMLSGDRIAFLDNNGAFFVKEGGLSAAWVEEYATGALPNAGVATQIALGGDQVAFLDNNGGYFVKEGGLGAAWVEVYATGALPNAGVASQITLDRL